jgi:hypothetical protein
MTTIVFSEGRRSRTSTIFATCEASSQTTGDGVGVADDPLALLGEFVG